MIDASFVQTSFLGGKWSERAQGRMELSEYKRGMNVCTNYYPVESGALVRRQGTRFLHHTRRGAAAKLRAFDFSITQPYQLEITSQHIRFTKGMAFVHPAGGEMAIVSISTATPAVVTVSGALPSDWATEDDVIFELNQVPCSAPELCGRQFTLTKITSTTFSLRDALTGLDIDGTTFTYLATAKTADYVKKIFELNTVYNGDQYKRVQVVQDDNSVLLLHTRHQPELITVESPAFAVNQQLFTDGPYLDENTTTTTITPSGVSGSVNLTASSIVGINLGKGFSSTDIGRSVRIRGLAPAWAGGTTYDEGQTVTGSDSNIYTSISGSNIGNDPISTEAFWVLSPTAIVWTWARITAWTSTTVVVATILGTTLVSGSATTHWRMGLYSDTTGWPTTGVYHEDRLWLSNPWFPQRVDASKTGSPFDFSPTGVDGTVADDNAISATADATDANSIFWMRSQDDGLFCGTQAGIWRIRASTTDDPISPTSIQMRRVTKVGATRNTSPAEAPQHLLFVHRHKRKVVEFGVSPSATSGTGVHNAPNLSIFADDLSAGGIEEIAYQHEPTPIMWARRADGKLLGMSYKRDPGGDNYTAWHEHTLGTGNTVVSIQTGPSHDGLSDTLHLITADASTPTPIHSVEVLTPLFDDAIPDARQWFVDGGLSPCCATLTGGPPATGVTVYGGYFYAGQELCVSIGGLDLGDYTVAADGSIALVFGTPTAFTEAFLASIDDATFGIWGTPYDAGTTTVQQTSPVSAVTMRAWKGDDDGDVTDNDDDSGPWSNVQDTKYLIADGATAPGAGLRRFQLTGDGEEILATSLAEMGLVGADITAGGGDASFFQGYTQDKGGNARIYVRDTTPGSNSPAVRQLDPLSHKLVGSFGVEDAGGGLAAAEPTRAVAAGNADVMAFYDDDGDLHEWIMSGGLVLGELTFINTEKMWWAGYNFTPDEPQMAMSGRPVTPTTGKAVRYIIGMQKDSTYAAGLNNTAIGVYKAVITNGAQFAPFDAAGEQDHIVVSKIGTFLATDIDAEWTSGFRDLHGFALDENDGQLIGYCATTQAVTSNEHLFKIDPTDASITWVTTPSQTITPILGNQEFRYSRIQYSTYLRHSSGGSGEFLIFDTTDGTETTVSFTNITMTAGQNSDDETMSIHVGANYSDTGVPAPAILGTYMPSVGNTFTSEQAQIWPGVASTSVSAEVTYTVPTSLGFCYTSQAQILRPDAGQDAGTRNGPAFGKLRRIDNYAVSMYRTRDISFGVGFLTTDLFTATLSTNGNIIGSAIAVPTLFTGIHYDTLEADVDFENMISWQQIRPYNGTVTAVGGFLGSQDK